MSRNINLIAISGRANSGKDLCGQIIQYFTSAADDKWGFVTYQEKYTSLGEFGVGYLPEYEIKKFADNLKDIVCIILGCTRKQLEDRDYKESNLGEEWDKIKDYDFNKDKIIWEHLTPRKLLTKLGTDLCRNQIHRDIWINSTFSNCTLEDCYIFTDMRFPNEFKAIKDREGITIRIKRPNTVINFPEHESETALDNYEDVFDYIIENDGTIEELTFKIKEILIKEKIICKENLN